MLKKYSPVLDYNDGNPFVDMESHQNSNYYLVSEVDAILNSAQLLKAKIAPLPYRIREECKHNQYCAGLLDIAEYLDEQLSAVQ